MLCFWHQSICVMKLRSCPFSRQYAKAQYHHSRVDNVHRARAPHKLHTNSKMRRSSFQGVTSTNATTTTTLLYCLWSRVHYLGTAQRRSPTQHAFGCSRHSDRARVPHLSLDTRKAGDNWFRHTKALSTRQGAGGGSFSRPTSLVFIFSGRWTPRGEAGG